MVGRRDGSVPLRLKPSKPKGREAVELASVLITGASGFIGSRLVPALRPSHEVTAVSRAPVSGVNRHVQGSFMSEEVLAAASDPLPDAVVHLASEIGGCTEEDGLSVNVVGTRRLLRSSIDRGVRRFVLASSIAAPIGLTADTMPAGLPIGDDHPCYAKDAYGLSKALMEDVAYYFHRNDADLDITLFRIGAVMPEDVEPASEQELDAMVLPLIQLSTISIVDVVTAIRLALERPRSPGVHRMNLVAPWARSPLPLPETLSRVLGARADDLDLSCYRSDETRFRSPFSSDRLRSELGFVATVDPRTMTSTRDDEDLF